MNLDDLRHDLAGVDRRILELVAERHRIAEAVGRAKDGDGRPIRDFAQEREVLERARTIGREVGIARGVAEEIMTSLVRSALEVQERQRVVTRADGTGRRVLVIGGAGRMGAWFVRFLDSQGFEVHVADPAPPRVEGVRHVADWRSESLDHDLIVVAADLRETNRILEKLAGYRIPGTVFDIGSLKGPLRSGLHALAQAGTQVTSVHPMFGPDTELLSGRHIVLVDAGVPEATRAVRSLFTATMVELVEMDIESHDRLIAYVLGLSHAVNIAFFTALAESGESAPTLAGLSSTTFDQQLEVATRVAAENPRLYFEIQHLNQFGVQPLDALRAAADRLRTLVASGDEEGFVALMDGGKRYFERRRGA